MDITEAEPGRLFAEGEKETVARNDVETISQYECMLTSVLRWRA